MLLLIFYFQVLKGMPDRPNVKNVKLREIKAKIDKRVNAQDRYKNTVSSKDVVRVIEGPFKVCLFSNLNYVLYKYYFILVIFNSSFFTRVNKVLWSTSIGEFSFSLTAIIWNMPDLFVLNHNHVQWLVDHKGTTIGM